MGINFEIERIKTEEENLLNDIDLYKIKILFLNEEIRNKEKEQIIIKYMQINKKRYINDLISKIKRGFIGFLKEKKYDIFDYDYKIYLTDYDNQDIINLILSYINILKNYKIKEELINSEQYINEHKLTKINLQDLFKNKIIICEVINKNSIVIPFLNLYNKSKISCPKCNITLDLTKLNINLYPCGYCSQNIYCSEECRNNDFQHIKFHSNLTILCNNSLKTTDIIKIKIENFLDKNSRNGLVGLINSGGNSHLLACIQALSTCEILTKFFLTQDNKYLDDKFLAKDKNSLISCYTELIHKMWIGTDKVVNPSKFCDIFFKQIKNIKIDDIDALDILTILLDKFHEELNEYKNKSFKNVDFFYQLPDETDKSASNRWLKKYKSINDSIIIDLFLGQLKQILICPYCDCEYNSYLFFNCFNLPIPNKKENIKTIFRVFPYSNNTFNYVEISYYDIDNFTTVLDIKNKIKQFRIFLNSNLEALIYENNELIGILSDYTPIYDYIFNRYNYSDENFIDYEITFIENPDDKFNNINFYTLPIIFEEEKKLFFFSKKNIISLTYCKLFCLNNESNIEDLEKEIFKYYRRAIDNKYKVDNENNVDDSYYIEFYQKINDKKYVNDEYEQYIMENEPLEIYFYHNLPKEDGWIFSGPRCEFVDIRLVKRLFVNLNFIKTQK